MKEMAIPHHPDLSIRMLVESGQFIDVSDLVWDDDAPQRLLWYTKTFQRWAGLENIGITRSNIRSIIRGMERHIDQTEPDTPAIHFNALTSRMDGTPEIAQFFAVMSADQNHEAFITLYDVRDAPQQPPDQHTLEP